MTSELLFKYKIIVDMYETKSESRREWEFESPMICSLEGVGDELIIEQGKLKVRKRIGITEYNNYYLMQDPVEYAVELTATRNAVEGFEDTLFLFKGVNYVSIENLKGEIFLKYIVDSPFANGMATQSDLKSQIRLKSNEIDLKVSKDQIISAINLSPEEIKIQAEKIKLEGITTINDGFKIDLLGNMTCNNATINGGLVVKDGLYTCLVFTPTVSAEFWEDYSSIGGLQKIGYFKNAYGSYTPERHYRVPVVIPFSLPKNFIIEEASIVAEHQTVRWDGSSTISKVPALRVYAQTLLPENNSSINISVIYGQEAAPIDEFMTNLVTNVWSDGSTGWLPSNGYSINKTRNLAPFLKEMESGMVTIAPITSYVADYKANSSLLSAKLYIYGMLKMVNNG